MYSLIPLHEHCRAPDCRADRHCAGAGPGCCIGRYPNLSETELARLINLYRGFSALDTALMLSDEALAPRLDRFTTDHRSSIRPPFRQYAGLLFYTILTLGALIWAVSAA